MSSDLEDLLIFQIRAAKLPAPEREYRFHPVRRWRFDCAWPDRMVAVEVEGGVWNGGRHVRGQGFERDSEKYSTAAAMGWKVLRLTGRMVRDGGGLCLVEQALATKDAS